MCMGSKDVCLMVGARCDKLRVLLGPVMLKGEID